MENAWCTGSAAWLFFSMIEYLLGLRRTYDGIIVRPCLPAAWPSASITRTYRGTTYKVTIENPERKSNAPVAGICIDGADHPADQPLPIDGKMHAVTVRLG